MANNWRPLNQAVPMAGLRAAIRAELLADGVTQTDLAAYLGVSQKHVSQVLTGTVEGSVRLLQDMATAVGLSITTGAGE
jgi:transcriptional regulator with XRE-family HTH domain